MKASIDFWNYRTQASSLDICKAFEKIKEGKHTVKIKDPLRIYEMKDFSFEGGAAHKGVYGFVRKNDQENLPRAGSVHEDDHPLGLPPGKGLCTRGFFYMNFEPKVIAWLGSRTVGQPGLLVTFLRDRGVVLDLDLRRKDKAAHTMQKYKKFVRKLAVRVSEPQVPPNDLTAFNRAVNDKRNEVGAMEMELVFKAKPRSKRAALKDAVMDTIDSMTSQLTVESIRAEFVSEMGINPIDLITERLIHNVKLPGPLNELGTGEAYAALRKAFHERVAV